MENYNHYIKHKAVLLLGFLFLVGSAIAQDLETYIKIALKNNPEIQKFEMQYSIASEKINALNTLPNTEFNFGYFVSEPETRTGPQRYKFSAKQMMPWFGTITSRENYANSLAEVTYEDMVVAKRKLMATVSQSFYNLNTYKAKQLVLVTNINLLSTYETLALKLVEVGKASAVDVLRLQMRKNELEQLQQILEQQYLAEQTAFNKLLNRDKNTEIFVAQEFTIPSKSIEINTENLALHSELMKYDKLYASVEQSELLNQKESSPLIGFGFDYISIEKRPDMNFSDNGKDIVMPMVVVTIPLFNKKYKSQTKQNALQQLAIIAEKQERLNTLETVLDKAVKERASARITYETQLKNLTQAKQAESILMGSYETDTVDFKDVLDIQELQLKFQMNLIEAIKMYYLQSSIINYLTQ